MRKKPAVQSDAPAPRERAGGRRATNVSLDRRLLDEAKALGINLSRACEPGLAQAIADARAARWLAENEAAIQSSNAYVERRGLPLARFRKF